MRAGYRFDDVWAREVDMCAFCAHPVTRNESQCPGCRRSLTGAVFRYAKASSHLHVLWVLLAGLAQLFLFGIMLDVIVTAPVALMVLHALLAIVFLSLAAGVYFRQFWAYAATIALAVVLLALALVAGLLAARGLPGNLSEVERMLWAPVVNTTALFLSVLQLLALVGTLIWAVVFAGPDFVREPVRFIAGIDRGLRDAADYFGTGQNYARLGLWATAILHWQRAAAREPRNAFYQRTLGEAYLRLGFRDRSLDMLKSAYGEASSQPVRQEIEALIAEINGLPAMSPTPAKLK
jgi:hypothetical protein